MSVLTCRGQKAKVKSKNKKVFFYKCFVQVKVVTVNFLVLFLKKFWLFSAYCFLKIHFFFAQTQKINLGLSEEITEKVLENIPLGQLGEVEDIANAVAFLVSDEARYITGQVLVVEGGMAI